MKTTITYCLFATVLFFISCGAQKTTHATNQISQPIAFPGAEGFGKYATGGRGGQVYIVSNLNDAGPGSLRQAVEAKGKRMIVFAVSGTIHLQSKLVIGGHATLAGHTAPGDGICIADYPVSLGGNNIIIRYLRFRMGDRYQGAMGQVDGSGSDDALSASGRSQIIIDHCSISWSTDEVLSVYKGDSTTLQWNIISEPLNYSYHFEAGDKDWEQHGFGGIWGGKHFTAHHNLLAHCVSRNPRFNGVRLGEERELADFRNNVIYNWGSNTVYGGEGGQYNIVNNYYRYGPSTSKNVRNRIANPYTQESTGYGKWYVSGNYVDEWPEVTANNSLGVVAEKAKTPQEKLSVLAAEPYPVLSVPDITAQNAYNQVLAKAGASFRRDTLDKRIVDDVIQRRGRIIDVQGGFAHGTPYAISKVAWPTLATATAPADEDKDGIPDAWETKHKLNPHNPVDGAAKSLHPFYTNLEVYINSLLHE